MELRAAVLSLPLLLLACGPDAATTPSTPTTPGTGPTTSASADPASPPATSATPTAAAKTKTMFVREKRADCEGGAGPQKCLQVREKESEEWTLFYSKIEGFTYEEGTKYQLEVSTEPRPNAPQDSSSMKYKLVKIVAQEKVAK